MEEPGQRVAAKGSGASLATLSRGRDWTWPITKVNARGPLSVLSYIWHHRSNRGRRVRALMRAMAWQIYKHIVRGHWDVGLTRNRIIRCHPNNTCASSVVRWRRRWVSSGYFATVLVKVNAYRDPFLLRLESPLHRDRQGRAVLCATAWLIHQGTVCDGWDAR